MTNPRATYTDGDGVQHVDEPVAYIDRFNLESVSLLPDGSVGVVGTVPPLTDAQLATVRQCVDEVMNPIIQAIADQIIPKPSAFRDREGNPIHPGFRVLVDLGPKRAATGKAVLVRARTCEVALDGESVKRRTISRRPWQVKVI